MLSAREILLNATGTGFEILSGIIVQYEEEWQWCAIGVREVVIADELNSWFYERILSSSKGLTTIK